MARPISYKGQVRKIARAYRNRDHGEVLWELVGLLIRDLEEDPSKIRSSGVSDIITLTRLIKDLEEYRDKNREIQEDEDFAQRLKELTKKAS